MMRLFLSYSHQDEDLRKEVEKHLAALRWDGVIDIWQNRRIGPGDEFDLEISNQRESGGHRAAAREFRLSAFSLLLRHSNEMDA